jgi:hypothetical protein
MAFVCFAKLRSFSKYSIFASNELTLSSVESVVKKNQANFRLYLFID